MGSTLVREDRRVGNHLQILILLTEGFVLNHELTDWSLFREVQLVDS